MFTWSENVVEPWPLRPGFEHTHTHFDTQYIAKTRPGQRPGHPFIPPKAPSDPQAGNGAHTSKKHSVVDQNSWLFSRRSWRSEPRAEGWGFFTDPLTQTSRGKQDRITMTIASFPAAGHLLRSNFLRDSPSDLMLNSPGSKVIAVSLTSVDLGACSSKSGVVTYDKTLRQNAPEL